MPENGTASVRRSTFPAFAYRSYRAVSEPDDVWRGVVGHSGRFLRRRIGCPGLSRTGYAIWCMAQPAPDLFGAPGQAADIARRMAFEVRTNKYDPKRWISVDRGVLLLAVTDLLDYQI